MIDSTSSSIPQFCPAYGIESPSRLDAARKLKSHLYVVPSDISGKGGGVVLSSVYHRRTQPSPVGSYTAELITACDELSCCQCMMMGTTQWFQLANPHNYDGDDSWTKTANKKNTSPAAFDLKVCNSYHDIRCC